MADKVAKTDLLRFSAWSIKDLITRKLSENTKFTDQIYEGSNLAIMIDLFSYMAQCMLMCLNNTASESMFSDTIFYENMNRLVKLIGYNPKGFRPACADFTIIPGSEVRDEAFIPRYSAVNCGKSDSLGKPVYYSFRQDMTLGYNDSQNGQDGTTYNATLYNGIWHMYPTVFTASGAEYETFVLTGVQSDSNQGKYAAHGFIDVYVERDGKMLAYTGVTDEIFLNSNTKYQDGGLEIYSNSDNDRYFSIRLNEDKVYEIKFGNGCSGQTLRKDDKIYVFYMESNVDGTDLYVGEIASRIIPGTSIVGIDAATLNKIVYNEAKGDDFSEQIQAVQNYQILNSSVSTQSQTEETVDDIREFAPGYYKLGNRLITKDDYEYYIKNRFRSEVLDVKCMNNWEYITTFFGWLYNLGNNGHLIDVGERSGKDPKYYISEAKLFKHEYVFADPADSNNVYLWVKMQNSSDIIKKTMSEDMLGIKDMTHETVFLDPVVMYFDVCAAPIGRCVEYFTQANAFDPDKESYIEITISDQSLYANTQVKVQVNNIILNYFNQFNLRLGQNIEVSRIVDDIMSIQGVERIRTVFDSNYPEKYPDNVIDGLAFATWSGSIIDSGDDLVVSNSSRQLESFQFPQLYSATLFQKIKVIKRSFSQSNAVQY